MEKTQVTCKEELASNTYEEVTWFNVRKSTWPYAAFVLTRHKSNKMIFFLKFKD